MAVSRLQTPYQVYKKNHHNLNIAIYTKNLIKRRSLIASGFAMCDTTGSNQRSNFN